MWIILLFLCVSVIPPNNAQESTNFQAQTATETYTNSDVNSDSTRSPVITLTIRNGRNENIDRRVKQNSDNRLYYSEDWKRMFVPIDADRYANENMRSVDHAVQPLFLRRPDSKQNDTAPSKITDISELFGMQLPILDFQGNLTSDSLTADQTYAEARPNENIPTNGGSYQLFDLYRIPQNFIPPGVSVYTPSQSSSNTNVEILKTDQEPIEISSSTELKPSNSDLITARTSDEISKPLPAADRQREQVIPTPADFYRYRGFLPQMIPEYFHPYPFLPVESHSAFQPMIPYLPNDQLFERERGSEVNERIQEGSETHVIPQDTTSQLVENIPSETSTSVIPQQPLPLPAQGYPYFGYPIPNIPQPGFPFNPLPLPPPSNVQRDGIINDLPQLIPVPPVVPEVLPDTLTPADALTLPEEPNVITGDGIIPEETVPVEEPIPTNTPYAFGFDMNDGKGNDQFRKEVSDISGTVYGTYGFRDATGRYRTVHYSAGKDGFHASVFSNEPGVASSDSADVRIVAEKPPPSLLANGLKVPEPEIIVVPDAGTNLIPPGSIPELK